LAKARYGDGILSSRRKSEVIKNNPAPLGLGIATSSSQLALAEFGLAKAQRSDGILSPPPKSRGYKNRHPHSLCKYPEDSHYFIRKYAMCQRPLPLWSSCMLPGSFPDNSRKINRHYFTGINRTQ